MSSLVHTIRFRLTLWYALVLSLVLALFGGLLYTLVRYQLVRHHDAALQDAAAAVGRVLSQEEDCEHLTPAQREQLGRIGHVILFHEVEGERRVFYRSPDSAAFEVPLEGPAGSSGRPGVGWFDTIPGRGRQFLRMYSEPYRSRAGRRGIIHAVEGLGDILAPLAGLRLALLWMAPLAVLVSAVGGYLLAGRALAPVDKVTRLAREIGAGSLSRRLPLPMASDEIGRLVETLNDMIARIEASFEAMRRFTSDASHELRGPLATMRGAIDVALARPREALEYRQALASVGEDVDRLRSITEDLLLLARADAGRLKLEKAPVRLDVVTAEVVESLLPTASERGVALSAQCQTPAVVQGDERWLRQLVFDLLDNAVKYSSGSAAAESPQPVGVEVTVAERTVRLTVADSGPGIPEEAIGRIFERFYRADDARTHGVGSEGSGLGLSIAAWIVEAHGGRITAHNRATGGSVFSVTFPEASPQTDMSSAQVDMRAEHEQENEPLGRGMPLAGALPGGVGTRPTPMTRR